ncbi:MAG: diguanylate cyclase [Erysipelotrichaceae bacterium]|nr:diguanylate cyclase [Erysipelotrichaceae bacterium]
MTRKKNKIKISIRTIILVFFILVLTGSFSLIGHLIFNNWIASANETTENIAYEINNVIYDRITNFMQSATQINDTNYRLIMNGIVDLTNSEEREKFFVSVLSSMPEEIYSLSYGSADGAYYGARRNENNEIEIMINDQQTGGNSWYYSVNEQMTAGELIKDAGDFDPRLRAWYQAAATTGKPIFSPIYQHFFMNDLAISTAYPIYQDNELIGVLGTHILLSGINDYLQETVSNYQGMAVIVEKDTGLLIGNSLEIDNFVISSDSTLNRYSIDQLDNATLQSINKAYQAAPQDSFNMTTINGNYDVYVQELTMNGIDWLIISAIPESLLLTPVNSNIQITLTLMILTILVSILIFNIFAKIFLAPIADVMKFSEGLSTGDLTRRIPIIRHDEFGVLANSLNQVADKMEYMVNDLETAVSSRTNELYLANEKLAEKQEQLRLILDSTAEAIYGVDLDGNCTFCNSGCLAILGYQTPEDLLGKNIHQLIHHSHPDKTPFLLKDCKIHKVMIEGVGKHANDEVFWRADGTSFFVEYRAYPQIKNDQIVGEVITFTDITERKKHEDEIQYLSCHDPLTGLFNRRCFDEHRRRLDTADNLPLSIIFADINGLKMANDIFGHQTGDQLIIRIAAILQSACRIQDSIARIGGDEFVILLPNTNKSAAIEIISQIQASCTDTKVKAIKCSLSVGCDTKLIASQSFEEIMANAENAMYREKIMNRNLINRDMINTIIESLHIRSPQEKAHSLQVQKLAGNIGQALQLPATELNKLYRASYLHDIGKIIIDDKLLHKEHLSIDEQPIMNQHPVIGYRILNLFDDTLDLAEIVYSHHERWDGNGYPRHLTGNEIPLLSRIIAVAETYDRLMNKHDHPLAKRHEQALLTIKERSGQQFDPRIVDVFLELMINN